jgi:hypothetical protein
VRASQNAAAQALPQFHEGSVARAIEQVALKLRILLQVFVAD